MIIYNTYNYLIEKGIKKVYNHGLNDFGFPMRTIICEDLSVWEYCAEDGLYENTSPSPIDNKDWADKVLASNSNH